MFNPSNTLKSKLAAVILLAAIALPAAAQDSIYLNLDQTEFTIDLKTVGAQSFNLTGSVFADSGNGASHFLDGINITTVSASSMYGDLNLNQPGAPLSDDPTGYFLNLDSVELKPGAATPTVGSFQLDALMLDPTGFSKSALVGDYEFNLALQENGSSVANQNFILHIVDTSPVPEAGTLATFGTLLVSGGAFCLARRRARK